MKICFSGSHLENSATVPFDDKLHPFDVERCAGFLHYLDGNRQGAVSCRMSQDGSGLVRVGQDAGWVRVGQGGSGCRMGQGGLSTRDGIGLAWIEWDWIEECGWRGSGVRLYRGEAI